MGVKYLYGIDVTGQSTFSTNVGIGTLSPSATLEVSKGVIGEYLRIGGDNAANGRALTFTSSTTTSVGDTHTINAQSTGGTIALATSSTERMRITNAGNVGIGTTSPGNKLHVEGRIEGDNFVLGGSDSTVFYGLYRAGVESREVRLVSYAATPSSKVQLGFNNISGSTYTFAPALTAMYNGNVGIGTTSPGAKLEVNGITRVSGDFAGTGQNPTIQLYNTDTSLGANQILGDIDFYQSDPSGGGVGVVGRIRSINDSNFKGEASLTFHTGEANVSFQERMRIDSTGATSFTASSSLSTAVASIQHYSSNGYLYIKGGAGGLILGDDSTASRIQIEDNSNIRFETAGSERMRIDSTGNVGIGTTAPDSKLHVESTSATGANFILETTHTGGIPLLDLKGAHSAQLRYKDELNVIQGRIDFGDSGTFNFIDVPNNSSTLYLKTGGNVGIGTTSPIKKLAVSNNGAQGLEFGINTTAEITAYNRTTSAYIPMYFDASVFNFAIGNVGIGTTAPENKLHVQQSDVFTGIHTTAGVRIKSDGGSAIGNYHGTIALSRGTGGVAISAVQEATDSDVMGLAFFTHPSATGADAAVEKVRIDASGNVGIGTTTPGEKLNVFNSSNTEVAIRFGNSEDSSGYIKYINDDLQFLTDYAVRIHIRDDGNVGIGTTSPTAKLDVEGDINIINANLSNQENLDVDTGTEVVSIVPIATYTAAFFDFVVKNGTNIRSGTVYACHDGTSVEYTETSTADLGNTSAVVFTVDISAGNMRLLATTTTDNWSVKTLTRTI